MTEPTSSETPPILTPTDKLSGDPQRLSLKSRILDFTRSTGLALLLMQSHAGPLHAAPSPSHGPDAPTSISSVEGVPISLGIEGAAAQFPQPWTPDGRITFHSVEGVKRMWFSSGVETFMADLPDNSLEKAHVHPNAVLSPSRSITEKGYNGYLGITSVLEVPGSSQLIAFCHSENWKDADTHFPFNPEVSLATSNDGGTTWEPLGEIIPPNEKGVKVGERGERVIGAGQPSAIIRDVDGKTYLYVYYVDWNLDNPDAIHVARSPVENFKDQNSWEKFDGHTFVPARSESKSRPVIAPQDLETYAAIPSVSWNTHLKKFLATYETGQGFNISTSDDGLVWTPGTRLLNFPQPHDKRTAGTVWNSYPTFVSFGEETDGITNREGILIYSRGMWNSEPHHMVTRALILEEQAFKIALPLVRSSGDS